MKRLIIGSLIILFYNPIQLDAVHQAVAFTLAQAPQPPADPNNADQVAVGQSVYQKHCAACHGANLEGQPNWRQRLPSGNFPAPPHDQSGHTWHHPDQYLFETTKYGWQRFAPPGYKSAMLGFKDVLSDAEIWAVLAFIKSRWPASIQEQQEKLNTRHP